MKNNVLLQIFWKDSAMIRKIFLKAPDNLLLFRSRKEKMGFSAPDP
jgi:hypothetical protein